MEARTSWLEERKTGIGGSDAAVVCGMSPWKTPHQLYLEKRGELDDVDLSSLEHVRFGNLLEDVVAQEFAHRTGLSVRRAQQMKRHPKHSFMLANIDRKIEGKDELLEVKTTSEYNSDKWGDEGTDQVPEHYLMQAQHYLAVTGWDLAHMAVLIGGNRMQTYQIGRNDDLIRSMIDLEGEFWEAVQTGTPPDVDYAHPSTLEMLKRKYVGTNGVIIDLPRQALALHTERGQIREQIKELEARGKEIDGQLLDMVGFNAAGRLPEGQGAYRRKLIEGGKEIAARITTDRWDFRWVKNA